MRSANSKWINPGPEVVVMFDGRPLHDLLVEASSDDPNQRTRAAVRLLKSDDEKLADAILQALPSRGDDAGRYMAATSAIPDVLGVLVARHSHAWAVVRDAFKDYYRRLSPRIFCGEDPWSVRSLAEELLAVRKRPHGMDNSTEPNARERALDLLEAYGPHPDFLDLVKGSIARGWRDRERCAAFVVKIESEQRKRELLDKANDDAKAPKAKRARARR